MALHSTNSKTYCRSATWNSSSPSNKNDAAAPEHKTRTRPSLPPLQPVSAVRWSKEELGRAAALDHNVSSCRTLTTPGRRGIKCTLDVKLDLSSLPRRIVESTEMQLKRDKFAFFEKECSRIVDHIYLGSDSVAQNRETLRANGITHVLNCVGFVCPEYFKRDLIYKTLWLQDSPCEDITSLLYDVFDYFEEVREQGGRVFVHCCQGVSRSTSFVIAYLMWRDGRNFEDAFQNVKAARGITNPNMGFACQLLQCQKRVHAAPLSPTSLLRMYRLAPHSHYQPLHLVAKMVHNPGAATLDSRGAFVIHVPDAIYIWIGHGCNQRIAHAARGAADQVVRYERAQGQTIICTEGEERPEFWDALSKFPFAEDTGSAEEIDKGGDCKGEGRWKVAKEQVEMVKNIGLGLKRVSNFDLDFELYQRASRGGVFPPVPSSCVGASTAPTRVPACEDGWSILRRKFPWGKGLVAAARTAESIANVEANLPQCENFLSPYFATSIHTSGNEEVSGGLSPDIYMSPDSPKSSSSIISLFSTSDSPSPTSSLDWSPSFLSQTASLNPHTSLVVNTSSLLHSSCQQQFADKSTLVSMTECNGHLTLPLDSRNGSNLPLNTSFEVLSIMINDAPDAKLVYTVDKNPGHMLFDTMTSRVKQLKCPTLRSEVEHIADWVSTEWKYKLEVPLRRFSGVKPKREMWLPQLYNWPEMQRIDMLNLDTEGVVLLLAFDAEGYILYVWVGQSLIMEKEGNFDLKNMNHGKLKADWQQVGQTFIEQMQLQKDIPIQVILEGLEPEDFWHNFVHDGS